MSQDQKRDAIIEAALKRFAHFGVAKTTMTEIGNDLAISKASLYYYFPDKINLYAAVLKSIIDDAEKKNGPALEAEKDPFRAMDLFLERRTDFIIKYHNILEYLKSRPGIPEELMPLFGEVKANEMKKISSIVQKGIDSGTFKPNDFKEKAYLLFDALEGLRKNSLENNSSFFPDKKQFLNILKREKQLSQIFLHGLTCL